MKDGGGSMDYQKPDPRAVKGWRISQGIAFAQLYAEKYKSYFTGI